MTGTEKQDGIVLKWSPFSKTSRVVAWLTRGAGKFSTIAKGAQRPRSPFLGQYDLFYTCEIVYYRGGDDTLRILKECSPLKTRDGLRGDWRAAAAASYLCGLAGACCRPLSPQPAVFALLDAALDALAAGAAPLAVIYFLETKMMSRLGVAPSLGACLKCRSEVRGGDYYFSCAGGGIICPECMAAGRAPPDARPLRPEVLALLLFWQASASPEKAAAAWPEEDMRQTGELLGKLLLQHLDAAEEARASALAMLMPQPE